MKKRFPFFVLLLLAFSGHGAGDRIPAGGRSPAMGGMSVTLCDLWSLSNNQAGAAWLKGATAGAAFENRYLARELMYEQLGAAMTCKAGTFGLQVNRFGNSLYSELKAGLTYARKFGNRFSAGVQIGCLRMNLADDYGSRNMVTCDIGLMYRADRHLAIGVQLVNPVPVKITEQPKEFLPSMLCVGVSWQFSETFLAGVELEKDLEHKPVVRAGGEYHFAKPGFARIGVSTNPFSFTFGFGLEFGRLSIDMASGYHQVLGFSPAGAVVYSF